MPLMTTKQMPRAVPSRIVEVAAGCRAWSCNRSAVGQGLEDGEVVDEIVLVEGVMPNGF